MFYVFHMRYILCISERSHTPQPGDDDHGKSLGQLYITCVCYALEFVFTCSTPCKQSSP